MKKQNPMNYKIAQGERCDDEIKTKPDQGLSVKTLFEKYRKTGVPPIILNQSQGGDQFEGEEDPDPDQHHDLEKIGQMELHDIREMQELNKIDLAEKTEKVNLIKKAAADKKAARDKEIQDSIDYNKKRIQDENEKAKRNEGKAND